MPRLMKKAFIKSGKARVEKMMSVGKSAYKKAAIKEVVSFTVISLANSKTRKILIIEKINGKIIVAVSLIPNIKNENAIKAV